MTYLPRVSPEPHPATAGGALPATSGRTHPATRGWLAAGAVAVLAALAVVGAVAGASANQPADGRQRVVVVLDTTTPRDPDVVAAAQRAVRAARQGGADVQLRMPRTPTEQLATTHLFAARGYDLVIGAGLSPRTAVAPVASRYPATRFALIAPEGIAPALARAVR